MAKEKINPPLGEPLRGYPTGRPNTGIGLDLYARAAVFGDAAGKPKAALVVLDTIQMTAEVVAVIGRAVAKKVAKEESKLSHWPPEHVLMSR